MTLTFYPSRLSFLSLCLPALSLSFTSVLALGGAEDTADEHVSDGGEESSVCCCDRIKMGRCGELCIASSPGGGVKHNIQGASIWTKINKGYSLWRVVHVDL